MSELKRLLFLLGFLTLVYVGLSSPALRYLPPGEPDVIVNTTDNSKFCILASLKIELTVDYKTDEDELKNVKIEVPKDANYSGDCKEEFSILYFWPAENNPQDGEENYNNNVTIKWIKKESSTYIDSINIGIFAQPSSVPSYPEKKIEFSLTSLHLLNTTYNSSFTCQSGVSVRDNDDATNNSISVAISGIYQIGEWETLENPSFSDGGRCPADEKNKGGSVTASSSKNNVGAIAGGSVAALVVLICISAFGLHFYRRNKRRSTNGRMRHISSRRGPN